MPLKYYNNKPFLICFDMDFLILYMDIWKDVYLRKISLLIKQSLDLGYLDEGKLEEYLTSLKKKGKINSEKFKKILMVLVLNMELSQNIIKFILKLTIWNNIFRRSSTFNQLGLFVRNSPPSG